MELVVLCKHGGSSFDCTKKCPGTPTIHTRTSGTFHVKMLDATTIIFISHDSFYVTLQSSSNNSIVFMKFNCDDEYDR